MSYHELLLGCGHARDKRIVPPGCPKEWQHLTTLDFNPDCDPDTLFDLSTLALGYSIPDSCGDVFADNFFDEIHAYEILEHLSEQGNVGGFFNEFRELWRLLKPNGYLCATVPWYESVWAWGDPSHTRIINPGTLVFLNQSEYAKQLGHTPMSDYRVHLGEIDFRVVNQLHNGELFKFILQAIKPDPKTD